MADNYLERRMEDYRAQPATPQRRAATLERLLTRNRSVRGYDARFVVRADQLRRIAAVCARIPSAHNRQALRLRLVQADEAPKLLPHIRMAARCPGRGFPWRAPSPTPSSSYARRSPKTAGSTSIWASPCRACCCRPSRSVSTGSASARSIARRWPRRWGCPANRAGRGHREECRTHRTRGDRRRRRSPLLPLGRRALRPQSAGRGADYRSGFGGNRR